MNQTYSQGLHLRHASHGTKLCLIPEIYTSTFFNLCLCSATPPGTNIACSSETHTSNSFLLCLASIFRSFRIPKAPPGINLLLDSKILQLHLELIFPCLALLHSQTMTLELPGTSCFFSRGGHCNSETSSQVNTRELKNPKTDTLQAVKQ